MHKLLLFFIYLPFITTFYTHRNIGYIEQAKSHDFNKYNSVGIIINHNKKDSKAEAIHFEFLEAKRILFEKYKINIRVASFFAPSTQDYNKSYQLNKQPRIVYRSFVARESDIYEGVISVKNIIAWVKQKQKKYNTIDFTNLETIKQFVSEIINTKFKHEYCNNISCLFNLFSIYYIPAKDPNRYFYHCEWSYIEMQYMYETSSIFKNRNIYITNNIYIYKLLKLLESISSKDIKFIKENIQENLSSLNKIKTFFKNIENFISNLFFTEKPEKQSSNLYINTIIEEDDIIYKRTKENLQLLDSLFNNKDDLYELIDKFFLDRLADGEMSYSPSCDVTFFMIKHFKKEFPQQLFVHTLHFKYKEISDYSRINRFFYKVKDQHLYYYLYFNKSHLLTRYKKNIVIVLVIDSSSYDYYTRMYQLINEVKFYSSQFTFSTFDINKKKDSEILRSIGHNKPETLLLIYENYGMDLVNIYHYTSEREIVEEPNISEKDKNFYYFQKVNPQEYKNATPNTYNKIKKITFKDIYYFHYKWKNELIQPNMLNEEIKEVATRPGKFKKVNLYDLMQTIYVFDGLVLIIVYKDEDSSELKLIEQRYEQIIQNYNYKFELVKFNMNKNEKFHALTKFKKYPGVLLLGTMNKFTFFPIYQENCKFKDIGNNLEEMNLILNKKLENMELISKPVGYQKNYMY